MTKKRHHYIPQFYLKGFEDPSNKPYIWVYDKDNGAIIKSGAKDIAVEKHYFSFINELGERDSETLENLISKAEAEDAPVIKKIQDEKRLSRKDRGIFAFFIASMMVRSPNYRKNIGYAIAETMKKIEMMMASHKQGFEATLKQMEKDTGKKITIDTDDLRDFILKGEYDLKLNPQVPMALSLSSIEELARIFHEMHWIFFRAPKNLKFVTSDNPLYYTDTTLDRSFMRGVGLLNENIEVTIPLSKNLGAFGSWNPNNIGYLDAKDYVVSTFNRRTILASLRFIFASEKSSELKALATTFKGSSPKIVIN